MIGPKEVLTARDDEIIPNFLNWARKVEQRLTKLETQTNELQHTKEELLTVRKTFEQLSEFAHADIRAMVKTDEINSLKEELINTRTELLNRRKAGEQLTNFARADTKALAEAEREIVSLGERLQRALQRLRAERTSISLIERAALERGYNPNTDETLPDWIRRSVN